MSLDSKKLEDWIRRAAQLLPSLGALWVALNSGALWLRTALTPLLGPEAAAYASYLLPAALASALVLVALLAGRRVSVLAPGAVLDLRVDVPKDLIGRQVDVAELVEAVSDNALVFLIGESGSGKSALVRNGLVPQVRGIGRMTPLLVSRYGTDWEAGPLLETAATLWEALEPAERTLLKLEQRPAPATVTPELLSAWMSATAETLGRTPLLIFDQFDDYQSKHRQNFLTKGHSWLSPRLLRSRNPYWRMVGDELARKRLRVVFVARTDAAARLLSVAFLPEPEYKELRLISAQSLPVLLEAVAPEGRLPPVIRHPDAGWTQLKTRLEGDLQQQGLVLPQRVRTVLLGLSLMPELTLRQYRRIGGAEGLEAAYVRQAIDTAARDGNCTSSVIRAMLTRMVDSGNGGTDPKTRPRSEAELRDAFGPGDGLARALASLQRSELLRNVPNAETGASDWQLDHDYLSRAVMAEERRTNRHSALLRASQDAWQRAGEDWMGRWRAMLPLPTQAALVWARVRGLMRYGEFAGFARWSSLRLVPQTMLAIAMVSVVVYVRQDIAADQQAELIVGQIDRESKGYQAAVVRLWESPLDVRRRVIDKFRKRPERLRVGGADWVRAAVGFDATLAATIANYALEERERLDAVHEPMSAPRPDAATLSTRLLVSAAPGLDTAAAEAAYKKLRALLEDSRRPQAPPVNSYQLTQGLSAVAPRLAASSAKDLASDFMSSLAKLKEPIPDLRFEIFRGLAASMRRLPDGSANELIRDAIDQVVVIVGHEPGWGMSYAAVLDVASKGRSQDLLQSWIGEIEGRRERALKARNRPVAIATTYLLGSVGANLKGPARHRLSMQLLERMNLTTSPEDPDLQRALLHALSTVIQGTDADESTLVAEALADRLMAAPLLRDEVFQGILHEAYEVLSDVSSRLSGKVANRLSMRILESLDKAEEGGKPTDNILSALGAVAVGLKDGEIVDQLLIRTSDGSRQTRHGDGGALSALQQIGAFQLHAGTTMLHRGKGRAKFAVLPPPGGWGIRHADGECPNFCV